MHPQTELILKALHGLMSKPKVTILDQKLAAKRLLWSRSHNRGYGIGKNIPKVYPYSSTRQNNRWLRTTLRLVASTQAERLTKS